MARRCEICGKGPMMSYRVSHSNRHAKVKLLPNLIKVKAKINGKVRKVRVCSSCLKAGKVQKVV